jgi:hypothetical protein
MIRVVSVTIHFLNAHKMVTQVHRTTYRQGPFCSNPKNVYKTWWAKLTKDEQKYFEKQGAKEVKICTTMGTFLYRG